jgi:hypothetical protein
MPVGPPARALAATAIAGALAATLAGHSRVTTRLSWHADVRPIVERHCLSCHTGRDATVSLDTYQDARPWARAIREEVLERRMPPWFARPGGARFANERRLSPVEIDLLVAWADGGAPEGKPPVRGGSSHDAPRDSAREAQTLATNGIGPERGLTFTSGVTRTTSAAHWTAVVPHCPSVVGSFSLAIERRAGAQVILEIADVSKAGARDPYRFSDPLTIPSGTRIEVGGSAGCSAIAVVSHDESAGSSRRNANGAPTNDSSTERLTSLGYWCPMHPEWQTDQPGTCPRCAMTLVDYRVDLTRRFALVVEPQMAPRAGRSTTLTLEVRERGTSSLVNSFERVHEQDMHVFIVSEDRARFDHVHPRKDANGRFTMRWTPPQGGRYKIYGDFLPRGGSPQMLQHWLVVRGSKAGESPIVRAESGRAHPATARDRTLAGVRARFETESAVSGDTTRVEVSLEDAATGEPVRDLQPYLGSPGHMFVVSSDLDEGLHAHPDLSNGSTGASQTFDVRFPKAGSWSIWVQVKRRSTVLTFPFAVEVRPKA